MLPFGISMILNQRVPDDDVPVPDDLPVLPDDVLLIIAREYRLATAEDRAFIGWQGSIQRCAIYPGALNASVSST